MDKNSISIITDMTWFYLSIIQIFPSLRQVTAVANNEWVVAVSVSEWYDDIFQNWLLWYNS